MIGEKFEIIYDKSNPSKNIVLTHKPVFLETEITQPVNGKITRLYRFGWGGGKDASHYSVEFEFVVNGEKIKKSQNLPLNFKEKYSDLKEGKNYHVRYWVDNPERAIIHINEPV